jgi:DNA-binding NarL/FixJ family response regulator
MNKIRVLIADDHPLIRNSLRTILAPVSDIEVIDEASMGKEAMAKAATLHPDVIVMDIHLPDVSDIEATRRILQSGLHTAIVMLTMLEDDDVIFAAMRAGAIGYILKSADEQQIVRAIHAAANGEALFSPAVAKRLLRFFSAMRTEEAEVTFPELAEREREILNLIAQGFNNTEIAERLVLSIKTVQNHVSIIFDKLQVADRAQTIVRAREAGLG